MISRILLIDIELFSDKNSHTQIWFSHYPIGLLYLASTAKEAFPELEFKVFHTATSNNPIKDIESLLASFKPNLIGLRAMSRGKDPFKLVAEKIRELRPDVPIIAGGPYPSTCYDEILLADMVNMAVIGEGELTFVDIIGHLMKSPAIPLNLKGTVVIEQGKVKVNESRPLIQNLDIIPFPDFSLLNLKDYIGFKNQGLQDVSECAIIFSTRGCPYGCFYCHQLFGKRIRRRSAENVVAEMKEHVEKRGIKNFIFIDDTFNVPMPEAKKILALIAQKLPGIRINFPNGFRADHIDDELIDLLEQAGTVEMALAVETAVPRLQKLIGKNLDIDKARKAIDAASRRFITRTLFIVGFPTETFEEAMETINFAASFEYVAQPMLSLLRVYNNSRLFDMLEPTQEQAAQIALQEKNIMHLEMFDDIGFYGDLFSAEKVPLKSNDIKELLSCWMRSVLINPKRINKSHAIAQNYLNPEEILEFYRNVFDKPLFSENDLQRLLKLK